MGVVETMGMLKSRGCYFDECKEKMPNRAKKLHNYVEGIIHMKCRVLVLYSVSYRYLDKLSFVQTEQTENTKICINFKKSMRKSELFFLNASDFVLEKCNCSTLKK